MKIDELSLEKLLTLYSAINDICQDYSRMTDGYSLATGDDKFESMPEGIRDMIGERQVFFSYRNKVKEALKKAIVKLMKDE